MDWQNLLATAIILFISATAFTSGFFQAELMTQQAGLREQAGELNSQLDRMETRAEMMLASDPINQDRILSILIEAQQVDAELAILNSTLSPQERQCMTSHISELLNRRNAYARQTVTWKFYEYFEVNSNENSMAIFTAEEEGFDYNITLSDYMAVTNTSNGNGITIQSRDDFLEEKGFLNTGLLHTLNELPEQFLSVKMLVGRRVLFRPIYDKQLESSTMVLKSNQLEIRVNQISLGVSLTAIAVILSSVMTNRLNERKNNRKLADIKAAFTGDKIALKERPDLIAFPVLVIAAVLSTLGVLVPLVV
ncbi:MAG: hypothetical protein ACFFD4_27245 [Candidatus Odinarchaeota archaeon]